MRVRGFSAALLAGASGLMLAGAFYFQHVEGLQPCVLCVWQRWAHGASLALGLVTLAAARGGPATWLPILPGLAFLAGAGIAGYHVAVEWRWIESSVCGIAGASAQTVEELKKLLLETDPAGCDEIPWSFAGVSMAGYNFLVSTALAAVAFACARKAASPETA